MFSIRSISLKVMLILALFTTISCSAQRQGSAKSRPEWVKSRPVNPDYYIGIGIASKNASPLDYQQIAKKNALYDLISEIKVTVSANSALTQYQINREFRQEFESQTRISALQTIEDFELAGSWEDKETYWVYYRLSREQYLAAKRRKLQLAVDRAEDLFERAIATDLRTSFMQALNFKLLALKEIQDYVNDDLQTQAGGRQVFLVNELLASIQDQMNLLNLQVVSQQALKDSSNPATISTTLKPNATPLGEIPLYLNDARGQLSNRQPYVSNDKGLIQIDRTQLRARGQYVQFTFYPWMALSSDSVGMILRELMRHINWPSAVMTLSSGPLKLYMDAREYNYGKVNTSNMIEPLVKRLLIDDGCVFVGSASESDYIVTLRADTRNLGMIYRNTYGSSLDLTISITHRSNATEVFRDALQQIKGYESTPERAGLDAYKKSQEQVQQKLYPRIKSSFLGQ